MKSGVLQAIRDEGSVVVFLIDEVCVVGDGNPSRRALEESGVQIGDEVYYEAEGMLLTAFAPVSDEEGL